MLCENCSCELGQTTVKRRRRIEEQDVDRLTNLPEPIIHHILSFLNTKSAIQTSVLSRSWRSAWKHVPVLDLRRLDSFPNPSRFVTFVANALSLRYPVKLDRLTWGENHKGRSVLKGVIEYAFSHGVQHLVLDATGIENRDHCTYAFSSLFRSSKTTIFNLKTLELGGIALDDKFLLCSSLPMLTTLKVTRCKLESKFAKEDVCLDLFANFPRLANLVMADCFLRTHKGLPKIRICGPQLVTLELKGMKKIAIGISAPKLEYLSVRRDVSDSRGFFELSLPSLGRADIALTTVSRTKNSLVHPCWNSLFQGLHNARSLKLDSNTVQILKDSLDDQEPSPFKKLESLIVPSDDVPYMDFMLPDFRIGKAWKMDRYNIKGLPLGHGWEFLELNPPFMSSFDCESLEFSEHPVPTPTLMSLDCDVTRWEQVMDYFVKDTSCKEPSVLIDFGRSCFVRKKVTYSVG